MNIILEAYLDRNFGDDLFVTILTEHYSQHHFFLICENDKGSSLLNSAKNVSAITSEMVWNPYFKFDAYVIVGGDFFPEQYDYTQRMKRALAIKQKGGRFLILGCSLYKEYSNFDEIRRLFQLADYVSVRDGKSYGQVLAMAPKTNVYLSTDMIFSIKDRYTCTRKTPQKVSNLGVCVREKIGAVESGTYEDYCLTIKRIICEHLKNDKKNIVSFLSLSTGEWDDRGVAEKIKAMLPNEYLSRIESIDYDRDVFDYIQKVDNCDAMISTRYHALAIAILLGKPFIPINYEAKIENFLGDLGYSGIMLGYGQNEEIKNLAAHLQEMHINEEKFKEYMSRANSFFLIPDEILKDCKQNFLNANTEEAVLADSLNCEQRQKYAQALLRRDDKINCLRDACVLAETQIAEYCSALNQKQEELTHALYQKQIAEQIAEQTAKQLREELNTALLQKQSVEEQLTAVTCVLQQHQENQISAGYAVNHVICDCNVIQSYKAFKLIHLIRRIRNQFLKGSWEERRKFLKWIISRFKRTPSMDNRFKPLSPVIEQLQVIQSSLFAELPDYTVSIAQQSKAPVVHPSSVTGTPAKCLQQNYDKPDIIMFSVINYDFRFQRPQHFAKRFAQNGHRVFYINANFVNPECTKEMEPGLFTVDFMTTSCTAIYFNDAWSGFEDWLKEKMDNLIRTYAIRDAIIVLDYPNWINCAEYLKDTYGFKMVADYMDDATGFLGTTTDTLKDNCLRMLAGCDLVVPSSQFLHDIAKQYNDKLTIVRNGTEIEHFYKALSMETRHERPVIGYYGAVSHWFAWETVCYLAKHLPECDIVIIGAVTEYQDKLERYSNIKLLGEMDYQKLPEHLAYFDVCLIPFDTSTDLIKATNPVKFYEYLSAGKRIVATEIPELEPFRDKYVYMSNDNKQFLEYVKRCLEGKDTLASREACVAFARENDWQHRYEAFAGACEQAVPKVSVIVLTYNNLKLNRYCINSILHQTAYPNYELIVIDNLSTDGTVDYLKELEQENHPRLKIIFNNENSGFAGGNNKAIEASDGKYVVLLNNDTVVTRGWLTSMVKHMEKDPQCGMVGAVTNSIGNGAMVGAVYRNLNELARFAYAYTQVHNNEIYRDVDRLALFCTMIRRDILEQHGMLDSGYKVGMFEDDDFAMLVRQAGYHFYAVEDCYIHHVNNASFKKLHPEEYQNIFDTNRARYEKKWNTKWTMPKYRKGVTVDINANVMTEPVED